MEVNGEILNCGISGKRLIVERSEDNLVSEGVLRPTHMQGPFHVRLFQYCLCTLPICNVQVFKALFLPQFHLISPSLSPHDKYGSIRGIQFITLFVIYQIKKKKRYFKHVKRSHPSYIAVRHKPNFECGKYKKVKRVVKGRLFIHRTSRELLVVNGRTLCGQVSTSYNQ